MHSQGNGNHGAQLEYAWCKYVGKPMMGLQRDER
nr:MAG TPA: hypothetical protein [Bacteriophage sp.]